MRFTGKLRKGFVLSKPLKPENYDEKTIYDLEQEDRLIITRKRDGWRTFAAINKDGEITLYTDGMNEIYSLDHIKEELKLLNLPPKTLLVGESVINDNKDDITKVMSILGSKTDKAMNRQKEYGKIHFIVFNILFLDGKMYKKPYSFAFQRIQNLLSKKGLRYILPVQRIKTSFDEAKKIVIKNKWEGLVLYDTTFRMTFREDGKSPKRPKGCYKWKPMHEDDFIVREWIPRSTNEVKELILMQIDPKTRKEFECGKLGAFTGEMRTILSKKKYPLVVQVKFELRFPKSGKLRNARFMRIRPDKKISDCIAPQSYNRKRKQKEGKE